MITPKYSPNTLSVSAILGLIQAGSIAIPEIQRPFVWKKRQVRDLMDSLYKGFPTGYLIIWKNPNVRLKDGSYSSGKKILIDGQQRVSALMTAIAGMEITNENYKKERVKIAFNPFEAFSEDPEAEIFAVQDSSHLKSKKWIPDIAEVFRSDFSDYKFITKYCEDNPEMTPDSLSNILNQLKGIGNCLIGVIELSDNLDIDVVTDIFIRINSKGTALSQGDFVMSKIAADEEHEGNILRKAIDYYAHLSVVPSFYDTISHDDKEFVSTDYFKKIAWLKDEIENVYDPTCDDVIRTAFMYKYPRAKMADLVSLLSGRDFKSKEFKSEIIDDTYEKLKDGVLEVINEYNFKQFIIAIRSAGFISPRLINSQMALDFAYVLYLRLTKIEKVSPGEVKRLVQKWYVLSVLTGRYSSAPESAFARDLRLIEEQGVANTLKDIEDATLSDAFWDVRIVQNLEYTSTNNPAFLVYLVAQVMNQEVSLLSNNVLVSDLIGIAGDIHHIFPKAYLKKNGLEKSKYNQEGNYVFLDSQVNKAIGEDAPNVYFNRAKKQCETKKAECGSILDYDQLLENMKINCVPEDVFDMDVKRYDEFLEKRRKLMAKKIKDYYEKL